MSTLCKSGRSQLVGTGMYLGKLVQRLAAVATVSLVVAGCTNVATPPQTPTPPVSQSPTESAQEMQQRLDYEAAEKSYRTFRAEYNRALRAGGAKTPTKIMKATAAGPYLTELAQAVEAYKGLGSYDTGSENILFVRYIGHSPSAVNLEVCEDSRAIKTLNKSGKLQGSGDILKAQLEVRKTDQWRVWSGTGKKVTSCD